MLGGSFLREKKRLYQTDSCVLTMKVCFPKEEYRVHLRRVIFFTGYYLLNVFVVWALSFPKLNYSSPVRKLILLSISFKARVLIEKRFSNKTRNFFYFWIFFLSRGLFSSPNSKKCLFFSPPPGGGKWPEYTPLISRVDLVSF